MRRIDSRNAARLPRPLKRLRLAIDSAKQLCAAVAHILSPRRYRLCVPRDLEHVEGRIEALYDLEIELWEDEFEAAGCVGDLGWEAIELHACGDFAHFGHFAAEHEEVARVVEVGAIVVWVALVEDGEIGGVELLAVVLDGSGVVSVGRGIVRAGAVRRSRRVREGIRKGETAGKIERGHDQRDHKKHRCGVWKALVSLFRVYSRSGKADLVWKWLKS